jgi:exosortase A-associated hydrolase 1
MKRRHLSLSIGNDVVCCTIDTAGIESKTGLIIINGGNEIRSGPHAGQAQLAKDIAMQGYAVMRFDRRGTGDSSGVNGGFRSAKNDIIAAIDFFRNEHPQLTRCVALGNCDAASALLLFHEHLQIDRLILTNPWTIDNDNHITEVDQQNLPSAQAIRQRYWQRLKDPQSLLRLLTGKIDLGKLVRGIKHARKTHDELSKLALELREKLSAINIPTQIILAKQDRAAIAFTEVWQSADFAQARENTNVTLNIIDSASHSFADENAAKILRDKIINSLKE